MKISIYELLGLIKDGKAPKRIKCGSNVYTYQEHIADYSNEDDMDLFDGAINTFMLNDEVEILDEPIFKKIDGEWYVRKDFKPDDNIIFVEKEKQDDKIKKFSDFEIVDGVYQEDILNKINELIDEVNKLKNER